MRDDWGAASLDGPALDRHITGNYGEDQLQRGMPRLRKRRNRAERETLMEAYREAAQLIESTADAYDSEDESEGPRKRMVVDLYGIATELWAKATKISQSLSK